MGALLAGPLAWLVILYLGSLAVLLIASFWSVDALSGELIKGFTFDNYKELWNTDVYRTVAFRTIGIASAVTVTDALLAFPIAFYMAKLASPTGEGHPDRRGADAALVLLPGQGLRLADDARRQRHDQLGARPARASTARASAPPPSGSWRATSGCRT